VVLPILYEVNWEEFREETRVIRSVIRAGSEDAFLAAALDATLAWHAHQRSYPMQRILCAVCALVVSIAACQPASRELTQDEQIPIIDTLLQFQRDLFVAAEAIDAERVLSFFAEDAAVSLDGTALAPAAFQEFLRSTYAGLERHEITWHPAEVSVLTRDIAIMTVGGLVTLVGVEGDTTVYRPVTWTEVFVRREGHWKLRQAHQSWGSPASNP
jgi:ketosteroid isomerase-like protein